MNWTEMEIFKGIDLNDSFVLSWLKSENDVTFNIEASIWPESSFYETPSNDEYTCYKKACLSFRNVEGISGLLEMSDVNPSVDANNESDYGNIDSLNNHGSVFLIEGDFGSVSIVGGDIYFEINET